jgi:transcription elongation GreA/GreB family factor
MYLMNEALARAHWRERMKHAEHERIVHEIQSARRLQRRAERAARRARKLAHAAGVALSRVG